MTNTAILSLTNAHGLFTVEVSILNRALIATANRSDALLRIQAAGHCGYGEFAMGDATPLDDCSRLEVLIAWIESGNHTF